MSMLNRLAVPFVIGLLVVGCSDKEQAKRRYFENGSGLLKSGKYQEAIVEFRNAVQQDEKYGDARLKLAEAYEGAGNPGAAFREYVRAADLLPANDDVQIKAATYLVLSGQFEDARTRIMTVIDRSPANANAQLVLGNALAGMKDLDGAVRQIEGAIKLEPNSATYATLALVRMAQGNKELARAAYLKAVEVEPNSVNARLALASFHGSVGELVEAEASLKKALEIAPKHPLANRMAAVFYTLAGKSAAAEPYLKTLAESGTPGAALQLADYYIQSARFADARTVLDRLAKDPMSANDAETRLAAIAYAQGDHKRAHDGVDGVIARAPAWVPALLLKARMLQAEGKLAEASQRALAATKADPNNAQTHYALGVLQAAQRQQKEAIASFNEVVRLNPKAAAQAQVYLSRLTLQQGDVEGAVQLATSALSNAPGFPEARVSLVRGLIAKGEVGRAEQDLASLLKQFPKAPSLYALEGALKAKKNDAVGARASFEKSLSMNPASIEALYGVTSIDLFERKLPQARARVEARLTAEPNRAELLMLAARVYFAEQDLAKAESALRRAIQADPGSTQAYAMLAGVLLRSGRLDAARAEYDQIAQRNPSNISAQTMSAMIVQSQRKTADAKKRYEAIVEQDSRAAVAANNLAWIYAEEGERLDDALRLARSAEATLPKSAEVQDTIGWIYIKKDLPTLAVPALEKSVEIAPDDASYRYHLALAYSRGGDTAKARAAVQQALKLKPDYADAQKLLAQLKG
jgi:tetratricopeptide (TPR) repeat protein